MTERRAPISLAGTKFEYLLGTVEAICASPLVGEVIIGITAQPEQRRRAYRDAVALQYPRFVILRGGLTREVAWNLEQDLQAETSRSPHGRSKYHPDRLGERHRRSSGGSDRYSDDPVYVVYMTWRAARDR